MTEEQAKQAFTINPSDRDWTEDFAHENGNYQNKCIECKLTFNGHKRRVICKKCATPNWEELAKRKPPEDTKENKAWSGAWLEGEMVGYAKCMIERVIPYQSALTREIDEEIMRVRKALNDEIMTEGKILYQARLAALGFALAKIKTVTP